ncbi:MAG: hypothetical protein JOZ18_09855, partial [Chloroflexi bacterium]|nr:hypothetical protein [Chloroflexota bacterium]
NFSSIQWSPDQTHIAFSLASYKDGQALPDGLYILTLTTGQVQKVQYTNGYDVIGWKDTNNIYLSRAKIGAEESDRELDLLHLTGGLDQIQTVFTNPDNDSWDASLTPDGQYLYINETQTLSSGLTQIIVQLAHGGQTKIIYQNQSQGTTSICAVTETTLLMLSDNNSGRCWR